MYYPDLSTYSYSKFDQKLTKHYGLPNNTRFLNIGWLDKEHNYEKGTADDVLLKKLFNRVTRASNMMRGIHECPFCVDNKFVDPDDFMVSAFFNGEKLLLGCKEIFVFSENTVFIAPDLIYHYVADHSYKPPSVFCDALIALRLI